MGKREETRLLDYYGWCNRGYFPNIIPGLWSCIDEIDMIIQEADELIKGHSDVTPLYYQSQQEKIDELNNNYISYIRYIDGLYMDVYDVDHAFFIDIKNNAVEQLSNIKQNKYAVQEGELADKYGFDITLTDFIVGQRTYQGHGTYRLEITELQDFSQMLKTSYEELAEEAEISTTDYILQMFENGEYDHSKYHPVRDFISGLLDTATLGILPMVELMAGYDFITGEELSSQEATNKGIEAVMGLVAIALIPFTSGGSVGLKAVGKQILVESATGVVSYTIYEAGEVMDMPAGITFALSIAGGGLTYTSLDGGMIQIKKNSSTKVSEKLLDQFNSMTRNELTSYHYGNTTKITEAFFDISKANTLIKTDSVGVTWYYKELENEFERRLLSADLISYIDDVPLGYRGDLRVPDYTKIKGIQVSDTGQVRLIEAWRPGTDGAVDGTRKMVTVSSLNDDGTKVLLDRIGGEGGNYFSPLQSDSTPYGLKERAIGDYLPESQIDINDSYHLYEMQQDFTRENFENAINNIVDMDEREVLQDQLQKYYDDARSTIETIGHDGEAYAGTQNGVKSGIIDKMFEMDDGGAIQYITPFNAEMLVELGMLKRVK